MKCRHATEIDARAAMGRNVYSGGVYSYGRVPANDGQPGDVGTIYRAMIAAASTGEQK